MTATCSPHRLIPWSLALLAATQTLPCQVDWEEASYVRNRLRHAMAYDSARAEVVMFGGAIGETVLATGWTSTTTASNSETWVWDGSGWQQRHPTTAPPAMYGHAMVYDSGRDRTVLIGNGTSTAETWEWDGTTWLQVTTESFLLSAGRGIAYDPVRQRVVVFGGADGSGNNTREFDGVSWTLMSPSNRPAARRGHAMAFDPVHNRVVMVGGGTQPNPLFLPTFFDETWEWDGSDWTQVATGVGPRWDHTLIWDSGRGVLSLFGGQSVDIPNGLVRYDDTRTWNGNTWTVDATPTRPWRRYGHATVYDTARGRSVVFGGAHLTTLSDTWERGPSDWQQIRRSTSPSPRRHAGIAFDQSRERLVMFGGTSAQVAMDDTWEWDGTNWEGRNVTPKPAARFKAAMSFDSTRGVTVLFGGETVAAQKTDTTWEWDGATWTQRLPSISPPKRYTHGMVFDAKRGVTLVKGGVDIGNQNLSDMWQWDGTSWTELTPPSPHPTGTLMAYDPTSECVILFTNQSGQSLHAWNGTDWTAISTPTEPAGLPRPWTAFGWDDGRKRAVLYAGKETGLSAYDDVWEWDGTDWLERTPATVPPPAYGMGLAYDTSRHQVIMVGNSLSQTWHYGPIDAASYDAFGNGCAGTAGTPQLTAAPFSLPWIDQTFSIRVTNLPAGQLTTLLFGFSNSQWGALALPFNLAVIGMPTCTLLASGEFALALANPAGSAELNLALNNDPALIGGVFHNQVLVADSINPAGLIVSNAATATIGAQ